MIAAFSSMCRSLLDGPLGETVQVNGQDLRVLLDRSAVVLGDYGQLAGRRVEIQFAPGAISQGDSVAFDMQTFVLDTPVDHDGMFEAWTVRRV